MAARSKPRKPIEREIPRREAPAAPLPLRLSEILGQDRAVAQLRSAMGSGRVHHAWIFQGPAGVGKFTTALAFAAVLLDPTSTPSLSGEIEPQEGSRVQGLLSAGTHPDLHIVRKELTPFSREPDVRDRKQTNIPKVVLEEFLVEPATRTGAAAAGARASKVFIVDEAELIDGPGQNSLLKTLEEPAPGTVLILVTSRPERLLPTIRSRCQRVTFVPLDGKSMAAWLKREKVDLSAAARQWVPEFAGGSPGAVKLAIETGIDAWYPAVEPLLTQCERGRFPIDLGPKLATLVDEWAERWADSHANASKDAANKAGARWMLALLGWHYRRRLAGPGGERALRAIDLIAEAESHAEANVQMLFTMSDLAARLAAPAGATA